MNDSRSRIFVCRLFCTGVVAGWVALALPSPGADAEQIREDEISDVYALVEKNDYEVALAAVNRVLRARRLDDDQIVEALKLRGSISLRDRDYDGAVADFSSALRFVKDDIWLLWQRCWAHLESGRFVPARPDCDRTLYLALKKYERVAKTARTHEEDLPALIDLKSAVAAEAELLRRIGEPERARQVIFDHLQEKHFDNDVAILSQLSQLSLLGGDLEEAERYISMAIQQGSAKTNRVMAELVKQRADISFRAGKLGRAAEDFEYSYELDGDLIDLLYRACAAYLVAEEFEKALVPCRRFYSMNSAQPSAIDAYGLALLREGKWEDAVGVLEKGLQHHPDHPFLRIRFSEALESRGETHKAEAVLSGVPQSLLRLYGKGPERLAPSSSRPSPR